MEQTLVKLADGSLIPRLGQGSWHMGDRRENRENEIESLQTGIEAGMRLIDTAEMYGEGASEELVGSAIKPYERSSLYLVSKVYPQHAGRRDIFKSCEQSLKRLGTEYLDLYLLHWRGSIPLHETADCMEELVRKGLIRHWGVSNFDTADMKELFEIPEGRNCATNQVLYHLGSRGIEYDLLPWMRAHHMPFMAYCPLAQAGSLRRQLSGNPRLLALAEKKGLTVIQLLLAFVLAQPDVIAIPKASSPLHVKQNAQLLNVTLSASELEICNREFPAPTSKTYLDIV